MIQPTLFSPPRLPGGAKGRVYRLLRDGGWTEAHPLVAARLERGGEYGFDADRHCRSARKEQPFPGLVVRSRPIGGTRTKPLQGFWVERRTT